MSIEIKRFRDETKLLAGQLQEIIADYVERETGRKVSSVELHGDGRSGIGAATIKFYFNDEPEAAR